TARELQAGERIVFHPQEVETRGRDRCHVGPLGLFVAGLMAALAPLAEKPRPGLLGLADKDDIGETGEIVFLHSDPSPADDCEDAAALKLIENFLHPRALDVHAGQTDAVGPTA